MHFGFVRLTSQILPGITDYKLLFERSVAFSPDASHVLAGTVLLLLAAAILRAPVSSWRPLLVVAAAQVANELLDFHYDQWPNQAMQLGESIKDCLLTLALPVVLMLIARVAPGIFVTRKRPVSGTDPADGD